MTGASPSVGARAANRCCNVRKKPASRCTPSERNKPSIHRRNDEPVLHRVPCAGGTLRAVGDDPPATVGRAGQITTVKVQKSTAGRLQPAARPQIIVMTVDDGRWKQTFGKQATRPV